MQTISVPVILTEQDFEEGSRRLESLVSARPGTPERYEADTLWLVWMTTNDVITDFRLMPPRPTLNIDQ